MTGDAGGRNQKTPDPTPFDGRPWGAFPAGAWGRLWLGLARKAPRSALGRRFGLLARRLARLSLRGPVDTELWGFRLRLFAKRGVSEARMLFLPQLWDHAERTALAEVVRPGFVFLDVGANVGGYGLWVDHLTRGSGTTILVEPDPSLAAQLRFNLAANQALERFHVVEAAAGAEDGSGVLRLDPTNRGENRLEEASGDGRHPDVETDGIVVPVRSLVSILDELAVPRLDGLKIDVEGHEEAVLEGFFRDAPVGRWPGVLVVELGRSGGLSERDGLLDWIEELGYRLRVRTRLNGVFLLDTTATRGDGP